MQRFVLVYTMGKVGSSSIANSLRNQLRERSVYSVHWLNESNLQTDKEFHKKLYDINRKKGVRLNVLPEYIISGFYVNKLIKNNKQSTDKLKVITLVRDPVAREVSSFFQNSERFFGINFGVRNKSNEEVFLKQLLDIYLSDFIGKNGIDFLDANPLTWFDEGIKEVLNVNIYNSRFPKEKGYKLFKKGRVEVLLIRLEDLNECFREASGQLLGKGREIIKHENTAKEKSYASIYAAFKERIVLPEWYLDKMYESKYAKHFYTQKEITDFKARWTGGTVEV